MGLFTLEDTIAIPLLQQMESLIVRGADEKKFYTQAWWKSLFGAGNVESSMEEQYGLNYPGEVLERYEERCGGGIGPGREKGAFRGSYVHWGAVSGLYPENKKSCGTGFLPDLHSVLAFREGGRTGEMVSENYAA